MCLALNGTFIPSPLSSGNITEERKDRIQELEERRRAENATFWAKHNHCSHELIACRCLHRVCARIGPSVVQCNAGRTPRALTFPLKLFASDRFRERQSLPSAVFTSDPTRLQRIVPFQWTHKWSQLNLVGQETKRKVMSGSMEGRGKVNTDEKAIREGMKRK